MFYVYYLYSQSLKKFYLGQTNDLERRVFEHNQGQEIYNRKGIPWQLIGYVLCNSLNEVVQLETRLKKAKNKKYVRWFIEKHGKIVS